MSPATAAAPSVLIVGVLVMICAAGGAISWLKDRRSLAILASLAYVALVAWSIVVQGQALIAAGAWLLLLIVIAIILRQRSEAR